MFEDETTQYFRFGNFETLKNNHCFFKKDACKLAEKFPTGKIHFIQSTNQSIIRCISVLLATPGGNWCRNVILEEKMFTIVIKIRSSKQFC